MPFSKSELERYSRQILLAGIAAQQKLKDARVLVVGAGGLGSTILPLVVASGIGRITVFDGDTVERANLGRQLMFREGDVGKNKALAAGDFLRALNPHVEITALGRKFTAADSDIFVASDLVFEGSDSLKAKFLVNDLVLEYRKPAFIAALGAVQGHAMLVTNSGACYRCVFDEIDETELPNCASEGIFSAFPAVVGAAVAHAAVDYLLNPTGETKFWLFEKNHCRKVNVQKKQNCKKHAA